MRWVKLAKYCEISGDTRHAVHNRRRTGVWQDGTHCKLVDNRVWVNMEAVKEWIENSGK